ncbi:MAG: ferredoxin [Crocinitomicaceae bacterium]|nr:ferredoxin [Crocinitomicaceae bacterium]
MLIVTLQRAKCIGCNYCEELCPELFRMSKKDGKSVLLNSIDRKGFHTLHSNHEYFDAAENAKNACPVKIISVKMT